MFPHLIDQLSWHLTVKQLIDSTIYISTRMFGRLSPLSSILMIITILVASAASSGAFLVDSALQRRQHSDIPETHSVHRQLEIVSPAGHDSNRNSRSASEAMHPSIYSGGAQEKSVSSDMGGDSQEDDREFLRDFRIGALARSKIHPVLLQQQRRDQVHQKVQMRRTFFADWDSAEGKGVHVDGQKEPHI
ncbi:hypothetical protein D9619_008637 [Psilocybe cf. subviscida]|uniref:Transmembrane protein n=1 Tax=Psilocybe cf. subviscida TaxID=2480587 RepID=A0A8H5B9T1_9AGAR|nr:hypothetical protein D9619_008637 [Psilocybe cf. subviscida]